MKSEIAVWLYNKFIQRYADASVMLYVNFWRLWEIFADEMLAVGIKHNKNNEDLCTVSHKTWNLFHYTTAL